MFVLSHEKPVVCKGLFHGLVVKVGSVNQYMETGSCSDENDKSILDSCFERAKQAFLAVEPVAHWVIGGKNDTEVLREALQGWTIIHRKGSYGEDMYDLALDTTRTEWRNVHAFVPYFLLMIIDGRKSADVSIESIEHYGWRIRSGGGKKVLERLKYIKVGETACLVDDNETYIIPFWD